MPTSADQLWRPVAASSDARWAGDVKRFGQAPVPIIHHPKFKLSSEDRYFAIGSCFARNIEEHLIYRGFLVPSKRLRAPKAEGGARPNAIVNKFACASMAGELERTAQRAPITEDLFCEGSKGWYDFQLCPGVHPVPLGRAIERRGYLQEAYFSRIRETDVLLMTLGLTEVWRDRLSGLYLNAAPPSAIVAAHPGRYEFAVHNEAENLHALERVRAAARELNSRLKFIVTVSPVPLDVTFTNRDVAVASSVGKSTLVAAANRFAEAHDDVDYFPSYEMVTYAPRALAFAEDSRHVRNDVVDVVMGTFLAAYMSEPPACVEPGFSELAYFAANPDAEDAVRTGELESGLEHWLTVGKLQGRPSTPNVADHRMRTAGIDPPVACPTQT